MREAEIIELIQKRDQAGIEKLLLHYRPLMQYIIAPILPNEQDREECLLEIAMRVWDKIELFDEKRGSWNIWLTSLCRNVALNRARKKKTIAATDEIPENIASKELTPEEWMLQKERQEELRKILEALPEKDRVLFYRKYYYMQSTAQIAAELGMSERAVEGKLYRLKKKLRSRLGGGEHDKL